MTSTSSQLEATIAWGPVHTYPEIFVSTNFLMRIHLASTRVRHIRSVYPEISVYALQSGNFCIRCVSGYVWTLVSVYFCIRWCHRLSFLCNAHALLTNPLRCPDTNRIRVDGRIRFVNAMCGRRYFCIRIKRFADTKISGYTWTGPQWERLQLHVFVRCNNMTAMSSVSYASLENREKRYTTQYQDNGHSYLWFYCIKNVSLLFVQSIQPMLYCSQSLSCSM